MNMTGTFQAEVPSRTLGLGIRIRRARIRCERREKKHGKSDRRNDHLLISVFAF